ncbi:type II secretion system F family protein [Kineosporia sp. R_H_3]|uniref:type II secretion system F family protein n=1 Tax=Kineosporia sp. R_H_3 TaxID=1961848 RepID=UPI001179BE76|nr:type II secretion system F family protein [Kineosporia sp. R_H_3]
MSAAAPGSLAAAFLGPSPDDRSVLVAALILVFLGLTTAIAVIIGMVTRSQSPGEQMQRRLSIYTLTGRPTARRGPSAAPAAPSVLGDTALARSAVDLAGRVTRSRGLDTSVDAQLEAAGLPLRTAEWLLIQVGIAVGISVVFLVISGGSLLATVLGLVIGLTGPWILLTIRRDQRESAFLAQLPDTLQLIAGSLQAGYSLPQALDTVVREGRPPMSAEFNRALIETRLGRTVEDALEGIASRTASDDFSWVVMAIRVQREIGGNLAELLQTVGDTIRERQRLRRQVKVLSAEGRLSAWILGSLPLVFGVYLVLVKPEYVRPMFGSPIGLAMVGLAALLLAVGAFWISRAVKVEV